MPEITIASHAADTLTKLIEAFESPPHDAIDGASHKIDDQTTLGIIAFVLADGYAISVAVERRNN